MNTRTFRYMAAVMAAVIFVVLWRLISPDTENSLPQITMITLLYAGLIFPVSEEIIFRALIQNSLSRRIKPHLLQQNFISPANLISSSIFAVAHALYFENPIALTVFFPSLVFGYIYEKERHIAAPIVLHSSYNLIGLFGVAMF